MHRNFCEKARRAPFAPEPRAGSRSRPRSLKKSEKAAASEGAGDGEVGVVVKS